MSDGGRYVDPDSIRAKYLAERDKRLVPGRADDPRPDDRRALRPATARTRSPPSPNATPVTDEVDVVIVGGGIAGVLAGAQLRKAGVERIRIVDQAGGIGGTWYWNRYPGVMCDVESYIYLPMLEELDYVPKDRYASGEEIRLHLQAIADRFDLVDDALFHTGVTRGASGTRTAARWRVRTDRGDELTCRYYVLAVGILNLMKLPAIPGMEDFAGHVVPHRPLGLRLHRRRPGRAARPSSATRSSASSAPAPPASSACPPLAEAAEARLRVPAHAVGHRRPRQPAHRPRLRRRPRSPAGSRTGWTTSRRSCSASRSTRTSSTTAGRTTTPRSTTRPGAKGMTHRGVHAQRRGARLRDHGGAPPAGRGAGAPIPATAEILKPYYRYLCKRPCFHDEYLTAFNDPNVTLVDCPGGIERVTEHGPGRRRPAVRGRLPRLRHRLRGRAHAAVPAGRPRDRRPGRRHPGREVGRRRRQPVRDDEPRLPEPVRHAGAGPAGGRHRQLHPARGARRRVRRSAPSAILEERGVEVFDVSAEAEEALDPEDRRLVRRRQPRHVGLHAVADQQRGQPRGDEPPQRQLRPRPRRLLRLPRAARAVARPTATARASSSTCRRGRATRPGDRPRSSVVTGGGGGIGAADRRGARPRAAGFVVTMDPLVSARRRRAAARARGDHGRADRRRRRLGPGVGGVGDRRATRCGRCSTSWSTSTAARRGGQRRRHHPADELRHGHRGGLARVLAVHLDGYLNILGAALPIMAAAGHGRILGVTSGSGWRPADTGAYGCAKRAVAVAHLAARPAAPAGRRGQRHVADRRDPHGHRRARRRGAGARRRLGASATGGLSLGSMPEPEQLGPLGAHLVGDDFAWCSGQVIFAGGSEVAVIERAPAARGGAHRRRGVAGPRARGRRPPARWCRPRPTRRAAAASNPRFGADLRRAERRRAPAGRRCARAPSSPTGPSWRPRVTAALEARGVTVHRVAAGDVAPGFAGAADALAATPSGRPGRRRRRRARRRRAGGRSASGWERVLAEHAGIVDQIHADAAWARAVADHAAAPTVRSGW